VTTATASNALRITTPAFAGGADELMACADTECCMDGPAGTGKSYAALWKMHLRRILFPGSRGLLARKTLIALKSSTLVTYREQVLGPLLTSGLVRFWAAKGDEPPHYAYWNGSKVVIVGLDKPGKAMSTEYDDILVDEALDTEESDIEALLTRIQRPGHVYGVGIEGRPPFAQLVLVTNPGAPTHWLNRRMLAGRTHRILSHHSDNPAMTAEYLQLLDRNLTGVRRKRLYLGIWAAAEGTVYEDAWNPETHVVKRATIAKRPDLWGDCGIDPAWPRYLGIDWGYRNPAVVKWYVRLPDGELVVYRELYLTMTLVEDLAREARALMGWRMNELGALTPTRKDADPLPREIIADHDAEDRATFERYFGLGVFPADKGKNSISDGIQAVTKRLQDKRLIYLADSLVRRDPLLEQAKKPCSSVEEFESYVWDTRAGRPPREQPIDESNHGMDVDRYVVRYFDREEPSGGSISFEAVGY